MPLEVFQVTALLNTVLGVLRMLVEKVAVILLTSVDARFNVTFVHDRPMPSLVDV
ncbi:MAG: hypothetical protein ACYTGO_19715 [Planctomycetota bacterium]